MTGGAVREPLEHQRDVLFLQQLQVRAPVVSHGAGIKLTDCDVRVDRASSPSPGLQATGGDLHLERCHVAGDAVAHGILFGADTTVNGDVECGLLVLRDGSQVKGRAVIRGEHALVDLQDCRVDILELRTSQPVNVLLSEGASVGRMVCAEGDVRLHMDSDCRVDDALPPTVRRQPPPPQADVVHEPDGPYAPSEEWHFGGHNG